MISTKLMRRLIQAFLLYSICIQAEDVSPVDVVTTSSSGSNASSENSEEQEENSIPLKSDCFHQSQLRDDLLFKYQINQDINDVSYLTAELIYEKHAWLSIGLTSENKPLMVGSQAIIGILDDDEIEGTPKMYSMFEITLDGVLPMFGKYQTLFDHKIEETDTSTILTFSKYLQEPFHHSLGLENPITLLYGLGFTHEFDTHEFYGAFEVDLNATCIPNEIEEANILDDPFKDAWRLHGILASMAWAIAVPLAFLSSMFRNIFPQGKTWMMTHLYLNVIAFILTIPCVIIAMLVFSKSGKIHFSKPHHAIGFIVLILGMIQLINGRLRPPPGTSKERIRWQMIHKNMGILTYVLSIYEIASGLQLYATMNNVWNWNPIFGAWTGIIFLLVAYSKKKARRTKKVSKGSKAVNGTEHTMSVTGHNTKAITGENSYVPREEDREINLAESGAANDASTASNNSSKEQH